MAWLDRVLLQPFVFDRSFHKRHPRDLRDIRMMCMNSLQVALPAREEHELGRVPWDKARNLAFGAGQKKLVAHRVQDVGLLPVANA